MVEETQDKDKDLAQLEAFFKYNISTDEILSGRLKILMADLSWRMDLPTWNKEELDIMCARMDALVEVYALTYQLAFAIADRRKNGNA
jgi:hypothetical protein